MDKKRVKIARAPRRANIIGKHIDYNEGYVLPCTIDRDITMAAQPADDEVVLNSMNFDSTMRFSTTISTLILETIGKAIEREKGSSLRYMCVGFLQEQESYYTGMSLSKSFKKKLEKLHRKWKLKR